MKYNRQIENRLLAFWRDLPLVGTPEAKTRGIELGEWHKSQFDKIYFTQNSFNRGHTFDLRGGILGRHEFRFEGTKENLNIEKLIHNYLKKTPHSEIYPIVGFGRWGAYNLPSLEYLAFHKRENSKQDYEVIFINENTFDILSQN